jgi:hypothetical protein
MNSDSMKQGWLSPLIYLSNNVISFLGVVLATTGGVAWLFILPVHLGGSETHPYLGALFFLFLPALFFGGLALIPLGIWLRKRKFKGAVPIAEDLPPLSWQNPHFRRLVSFVGLVTLANVVIGGHFTYAAVDYMDSVSFCGQACHTVMQPEFTAYQESAHFRVGCTECHIGEGASWFVRSKLSGVRQVFAVMLNTYSTPIPTPVHNLRPAQETCENCHWPAMFSGFRLRIWDKFAEDEANTHSKTVLMMRIGGGPVKNGIHGFHLAEGVHVEYLSDPARQTIPLVAYTDASGKTTEYKTEDWDPAKAGEFERRSMDCLDCHTRPSHEFRVPGRALDRALAEGTVPADLPFVKQKGMEIIQAEYESRDVAAAAIPQALADFYSAEHPDIAAARTADIEKAGQGLTAVYMRNIFPAMNVGWGTYPNNIGHTDFPGCFRCHDDLHASADGATIKQDCSSCHELLAMEEENPEILTSLGISAGE